jgi:hypothetical protein
MDPGIQLSPNCVRICHSRGRSVPSATPQPRDPNKKCTRFKSSLKRFPILQNVEMSEHVPKCIKVNSIFKSFSSDSSYSQELMKRRKVDCGKDLRKFKAMKIYGYRTRVNYYRIRHDLNPSTNLKFQQLLSNFNLTLRGTNFNFKKVS